MFGINAFPLVALVAAFTSTAHAATCEGVFTCLEAGGALARTENLYAARSDFCGQDRWKTYGCVKYTGGTAPVYISLDHTNLNSRQTCWDALEQIITQCEGEPNGYYDAPGQRYRLTGCTYYKPCEPNTTIGI